MNDTVKEFKLNNRGICNFCEEWENEKKNFIFEENYHLGPNLKKIKQKIQNQNSIYDCVVGLSGGVDSSYVVYLLWKLKLNPIIIHMDNGWNSKISNSNISKILDKTKFDFKTLIINWREFKDLQRSFLFSGVPDIELATDHAIFAYILNFALDNNIKYIVSGVNFATEHSTIPSWGWRKDDFNHIASIHKIFGNVELKTFPKMTILKRFFYEKLIKKVQTINILDHINYSTKHAKEVLNKEFDFEDYGSKHQESFFTMFFQGYILPKKFKIDKRILHLSCLIRNKEISRNKALDILSLPNIDTQKLEEYKNYFKKKLSLSDEEFSLIMNSEPVSHYKYSNTFFESSAFFKIKKFIKKIT